MRKHLISVVRVCFWAAIGLVLFFSLLPVEHLPPIAFDIWDKTQHALGFLTLGLLGFWAYEQAPKRIFLGLVLYGAGTELLQSITGWRHGDWLDWLANNLGVATACFLFWQWKKFDKRNEIT